MNRKLKLKIDWNKLREVCSIKRSTYDKLVTEMEVHTMKLLGKIFIFSLPHWIEMRKSKPGKGYIHD